MSDNRTKFLSEQDIRNTIAMMESQAVSFAYRFTRDSSVRQKYINDTREMSKELVNSYKQGVLTPKQAAQAANQMRNEIMEFARVSSSDIGRAKAKALKSRGLDLDGLTEKYSKRIFGIEFAELNDVQKNSVYLEIVESSGRARPSVNRKAARLGNIGRGLWVLTACLAIYNVSVADNKTKAAGREAANVGGGFAGGAGGGALAGVWCGPIGVGIGVIVGGLLGALISDQIYVEIAGPDGEFARQFLPRFTSMIGTKEKAIADALIQECGYDVDKVLAVFVELNDKYNTDADDVANFYIENIRNSNSQIIMEAFRLNVKLRKFLIRLLDEGWTTDSERKNVHYLKGFG